MIKPVLQRVESAEQLHQIEENSPHIKGEDAELWKALIARDIPNWRTKNYVPKNPLKWYEIYCKYKKEQIEEIKRDEDILRQTMMGIKQSQLSNVVKLVDRRTMPAVPRDPRMIANDGGVPLKGRGQFRKQGSSSLSFSGGSRTKITDGQSVLTKARREAKEISAMGKLAKPTHQLKALGTVKKAPAAMATQHKIANQPAIKMRVAKRPLPSMSSSTGLPSRSSLEERENRLRAMQSRTTASTSAVPGKSSGTARENMVGSSDDEAPGALFDDDEEDDEPRYRQPTSTARQQSNQGSRPTLTRPQQVSSSPPSRPTSGASYTSTSRTESPAPSAPRPMMKRKPAVDVFNRSAKKSRR